MSEDGKTKLEAYANGQTMRKRQSPKRKKSNVTDLAQKKTKTTSAKKTQLDTSPTVVSQASVEEQHNIIFKPNEGPQTDFLAAGEREVLFGGSAGGGKSYAMLADPLRSFLSHKKCTLRFGPALSGRNVRCSGLRPLVRDCGCHT